MASRRWGGAQVAQLTIHRRRPRVPGRMRIHRWLPKEHVSCACNGARLAALPEGHGGRRARWR